MSTRDSAAAPATGRAQIQFGALLVGVVFLLVGLLGFIPGVTRDYSMMSLMSRSSGADLFGLFQISVLHNLVHLAFGVVGVVMSRSALRARNYLFVGGVIYVALFLYGIVVPHQSAANFVPLNDADDWLHAVLGAGMILLSIVLDRGRGRH